MSLLNIPLRTPFAEGFQKLFKTENKSGGKNCLILLLAFIFDRSIDRCYIDKHNTDITF